MNQEPCFSSLEKKIGYSFQNIGTLIEAMSHDSLRSDDINMKHYQRLEYLGDAVIHFVITNYLFQKHPDMKEGQLSSQRARFVSSGEQQQIAKNLELKKFVRMSKSVKQFLRYDKFLEALIGAIYYDAGGEMTGYPAAKSVIYKLWGLHEALDPSYETVSLPAEPVDTQPPCPIDQHTSCVLV